MFAHEGKPRFTKDMLPPTVSIQSCYILGQRSYQSKISVSSMMCRYRSGSSNGSCRQMGHPAPTWVMHGKRQNVMHGPAGLTQTEKMWAKVFSRWKFKQNLAWINSVNSFMQKTIHLMSNFILISSAYCCCHLQAIQSWNQPNFSTQPIFIIYKENRSQQQRNPFDKKVTH